MLSLLATGLAPFLVVITLIVAIHELGHFLTARAFGVKVDRFSIGFGPTLAAARDRWGVEWRLAWLPLGGYVRFAGDENAASVPDQEDLKELRAKILADEGAGAEKRYFYFKPLWQRALVVFAGPAANFVLASAIFAILFGVFGDTIWQGPIAKVMPGSAAAAAGFEIGDEIIAADGHRLRGFDSAQGFGDLHEYVAYRNGVPIDFTVERGGQFIHIRATPGAVQETNVFGGGQSMGRLGVALSPQTTTILHRSYNPIEAIGLGAARTWDTVEATGLYLGGMFTGRVSPDQLHSVIGTAEASGAITREAIDEGRGDARIAGLGLIIGLANFCALISVTVGLVNLLPIPILDGGHLLFYAYEAVVRRPVSAAVQAAGYRVGLALLACLLLFATGNDLHFERVFHLLGGHS
ncbi:MAG TPA: M50 family metallopeptidase [Caulobacteraceae bacterium]|nr:M50 family metallopeptidase [Caulobacteraceae bacterium]